jgi:hypothetical protein
VPKQFWNPLKVLTLNGLASPQTRSMLLLGLLIVTLHPAELVWLWVPPGHSALSNRPPLLLFTVKVKSTVPQQTPLPTHDPLEQLSEPLQDWPSLQAEPLVSAAVQLSAVSLQLSEQLPSPSGPGHGLPTWVVQAPEAQESAPLQNRPSLHAEPLVSAAVQLSAASLQLSEQLPSPSAPGHGSPLWVVQLPAAQVSVPLQNRPSVQAEPLVSAPVQLSASSSQDSEQLPSPSAPGHGSPA